VKQQIKFSPQPEDDFWKTKEACLGFRAICAQKLLTGNSHHLLAEANIAKILKG
jgi:hypothetical protein